MTEVIHRDDPGRRGILTGRKRERSDGAALPVRWQDNTLNWVPEYLLIVVEEGAEDVFPLLERQRFGRVNDLRRNLTHIHLSGRLANVVCSMDTTNADFYAVRSSASRRSKNLASPGQFLGPRPTRTDPLHSGREGSSVSPMAQFFFSSHRLQNMDSERVIGTVPHQHLYA